MRYHNVLEFWYAEENASSHFDPPPAFDQEIRDRFGLMYEAATKGELYQWRSHPKGRLAEVIVLDQFPRNIYRDDPRAFASDGMALILAQEAVLKNAHQSLRVDERSFLFMPYMHSESKEIHKIAMQLFDEPGLEYDMKFEVKHKEIIDRFGRYPHRNKILGRESTPEELEFLKTHRGF